MLSVGIDLSMTNTGLICLKNGKINKQLNIKTTFEGRNIYDRIKRIEKIKNDIMKFLDKSVDIVVIEGYSFLSRKGQAFSLGELGGVIKYFIIQNSYNLIEVSPTQLKKFVTGKGNCEKDLMLKEVYKYWKADFNDNNLADAFGLAKIGEYILSMLNGKDVKINNMRKEIIKSLIKTNELDNNKNGGKYEKN